MFNKLRNTAARFIDSEDRNFTDALVTAIQEQAEGVRNANPQETTAVMSASGLLGRSLAMADVFPLHVERYTKC